MTEEFEEPQPQGQDFGRYLDILKRRHMQFLIPLFAGWLLIWGASWILPARYKSTTLILVEEPTMPKDYVVPNISDDLQARLQSISQQILSRTRLLTIIDKLNLYENSHHHLTADDKVEMMRKDTDVELVRASETGAITAFKVSFSARDPRMAQQVTRELTELFITANLRVRQQESEDTTKFIEQQLTTARASLAEQEAKVREFQGAHEGELPSQQTTNLQILSGLQSQLQNEQDALNTAKQQRVYYQSMLAAQPVVRGADGAPLGLAAIDHQLELLRAQLADLSSRYTDQYPDVVKVKEEIAKTERMRTELLAELKKRAHAPGSDAAEPAGGVSATSPVAQLQGQLHANETEIKNREAAVASLEARIGEYQSRLNQEPVREQQLADLTRGYEQSKANYDDLLKKESQSQMATSMEQMQQGERFTMLDPPSLPQRPDFPNRVKFTGIGFGFGLVLGALVVGVLEFMDDRLHSDKEIKSLLPVPVIAEIPNVDTDQEKRRERLRGLGGWAAAAAVLVVILVGSAISYLRG